MRKFDVVLKGVDWELLAIQRQELALAIESVMQDMKNLSPNDESMQELEAQYEAFEGILSLLDNLSDVAEQEGLFTYEEVEE